MDHSPRPILYSFRRCPYAMRSRLALYTSAIKCDLREVVLRDKPEAMIVVSPKATVPVLELASGQVIEESLPIMLWALKQKDPEGWLSPETGTVDEATALVAEADSGFKDNLDRYKYPTRYAGVDPAYHRFQGEMFLKKLDALLQQNAYLFGARICIADVAIAPFVRQFANTDRAWFDVTPYEALQRWLAAFLESKRFNAVMTKYPQWRDGDPITVSPVMSEE